MNSLRVRFAVGFSILFTVLFTISFVIVYFSYADYREETFFSGLKDRARTTFKLLIEVEQVDLALLKVIDRNTLNSLSDEKVVIVENDTVIYSSIDHTAITVDKALLQKTKAAGEYHTMQDNNELLAIYVRQDNKDYYLLASAFDKYGLRKLNFLRWLLLSVYTAGMLIAWATTWYFVKKVIRALEQFNSKLQQIHSENMDTRFTASGQGAEVDSLASSFNALLERLRESFSIQKDFAHYASHELRTPLAAMIGTTESAMHKQLSQEEHAAILQQLFRQQQQLAGMTNSLLLLSDKNVQETSYPLLRLDEMLFRSADIIRQLFPGASVQVNLEGDAAEEAALQVRANEPLLMMALNNLLKNAVQYSPGNAATVTLRFFKDRKEIEYRNIGQSFTDDEQQLLFTAFYRGPNAGMRKGSGLGLPLVRQIAELHHATVSYRAEGGYNVFLLRFAQ